MMVFNVIGIVVVYAVQRLHLKEDFDTIAELKGLVA
jgi:hypothetical protein